MHAPQQRKSVARLDADVALELAAQAATAGTSFLPPQHSQVEESRQAIARRRASASTGKTHFRLASGVLSTATATKINTSQTQGQHSYDDAWSRWMQRGGPSSTHDATPASPASTSFYNAAWQRWMGSSEANAPVEAVAATEASSATLASAATFESVPRQATKPIMSRLPLAANETPDAEAADPTRADGIGSLDYLEADGGHAGILDAADNEVKYTRARLPVLDDESLPLWHALHSLRGISDDYADGYGAESHKSKKSNAQAQAPHPIAEGMDASQCPVFASEGSLAAERNLAVVKRLFNWNELPDLPLDLEYTWYGVTFRSKRKPGSESMNFYEADRLSHEEAVDCGGLLMYWYGSPNATTGHNLATCIWTSREDAKRASALPLHARAAAYSTKAYESFELSRYAVRKVKGESRLRLESWVE